MYCKMADDFFWTVRPSSWTSCGNCERAVCTRLLTALALMSGSLPSTKLTVAIDLERVKLALDSALEEAGFELSVPHDTIKVSRPPRVASSLISGNEK